MDIFGTIVGTIDLAVKLTGYLQAVKGAKEDRRKLLPEISALGALLQVLHGRLGNSAIEGASGGFSNRLVMAGIGEPLRKCGKALGDIAERLERLVLDANAGKSSSFSEKMKDIRWPFRQEEIRSMLGQIERLKSLISLAFQTSLMEFIEQARDELAAAGLNVAGIESAVSTIEAAQRVHTEKIESLHVDLQALGWTLRGSASSITRIEDTVAIIHRNQQDQRADLTTIKEGQALRAVLKWLSPLDFSGKHNAASEMHAPGTGEWFLGHPRFLAWQRGDCRVLWCPGGPGVGKSVMASAAIRRLQGRISEDMAVAYIYFEYTTKYTAVQLLEALLSQLVRRRITPSGMESLQSHMAGNRPTQDELMTILKLEAAMYSRVFIVVDALDETDIQIWAPLLSRLRAIPGIGLLATSRDTGEIAVELQPDRRLDVMADPGDMRKYIEERLSSSTGTLKRLLAANPSLHDEIVTGVTERAAGMFLLARLHMNSLQRRARLADLRRAMTELPGDLRTAYDDTIGRISDEDKPLAYQIFSWLMHAARPMTMRDLRYALAVEEGMAAIDTDDLYNKNYLTSICVGLIVLQDSDAFGSHRRDEIVVGLAHYSTQEYLHQCASAHLPHPAHLAITCLRYLSFDIFDTVDPDWPLDDDRRERLVDTPFVRYAVSCWGDHARMHCDNSAVRDLAMRLLHDNRRVATVGSFPCFTRRPSAVHLCAYFGLTDYLEYLLDNGFDVNSEDSEGDTAVTEAAVSGQEEVMRLLLSRDDVDVNPRGGNGNTPLSWAIIYGWQGIVELLLARDDVDVNSRNDDGMTPIAHAVQCGLSGIAKLLLARSDVDVNSQDEFGDAPLISALYHGYGEIVRLLLARDDLDTNLGDDVGNRSLTIAASRGDEETSRMLLGGGDIYVNAKNEEGLAAIFYAASRGHDAVMKLLLEQDGVDINPVDSSGATPLDYTERDHHESIAQLLRAAGGRTGMELRAERGLG